MQCPVDGVELKMTERQGIEIDYCPTCRGVWLDRGELDKIIERSGRADDRGYEQGYERRRERDRDDDDDRFRFGRRRRKREGFLSELFEFGD